jgi:hypothetical protein
MAVFVPKTDPGEMIEAAFDTEMALLSGEFTLAISNPIYDWPNGQSPRDIVDKGGLRSSQEFLKSGAGTQLVSYVFRWNVEHSLYVLMGYTHWISGKRYPGRDWINQGLAQLREHPGSKFNQ